MGSPPVIRFDLNNWQVNGIAIAQKDLGAPQVREVTYNHASSDGVDDVTQFFGQRVVSLTGQCFTMPGRSRTQAWFLLQPFLDPQGRFKLWYAMDDDVPQHELRNLRISQWQKMASSPTSFAFQVQWKADPEAHDCEQQSVTMTSLFTPALGRLYNRNYNLFYPTPVAMPGSGVAYTDGTYKTWPIYRFFGPCTNPVAQLRLVPNGPIVGQIKVLIQLFAGDMLEIDSQARTVMLGGATGSNRYNTLDFVNTIWTPMGPGNNYFRFTADAAAAPASMTVLWNDAYL